MSSVDEVSARYDHCENLLRSSIELVAVEDPIGAQYHRLINVLQRQVEDQPLGFLRELLDWAKVLRFHLLTEPIPITHAGSSVRIADWMERERPRAAPTADTTALWQAVIANAGFLAKNDPAVARVILDSCFEAGVENCVVLAHSETAADALDSWLADFCIRVVSPSDYLRDTVEVDITYAVGPPNIFRSAIYSVPAADELTYIYPSWFPHPELPPTPLAGFAEFGIMPRARRFSAGERIDCGPTEAPDLPMSAFLPTPSAKEPAGQDVVAAGGMEIFISDVDRVRRLDPTKQPSDRIAWTIPLPSGREPTSCFTRTALGTPRTIMKPLRCSQTEASKQNEHRPPERASSQTTSHATDSRRSTSAAEPWGLTHVTSSPGGPRRHLSDPSGTATCVSFSTGSSRTHTLP